MRIPVLCLLLLAIGTSFERASAQTLVREWKPGTPGVDFLTTQIDARGVIRVQAGDEAVVPVLRDVHPGLKLAPYVLRGEVKHESVGGTGFLEMWSVFPPQRPGESEGKYYSRGLGELGPMQWLQGNSAWREFVLPFNTAGFSASPVRLEFNVVLPDGGIVWLRNLRVVQSGTHSGVMPTSRWLTPGFAAGSLGAAMAILALVVGICLHKGRGRALARGALAALLIAATVAIGAAVWMATASQWMWMTIFSLLAAIVFLAVPRAWVQMTTRFEEAELRRMQAADA